MAVTRTACSYCGVGCGIQVETTTDPDSDRPVIARVSGDKLHPTNFGRLCTKGATHAELMAADDGARSSTNTALTPLRCTYPARCRSNRSTWQRNWPRDSCKPSTWSPIRG